MAVTAGTAAAAKSADSRTAEKQAWQGELEPSAQTWFRPTHHPWVSFLVESLLQRSAVAAAAEAPAATPAHSATVGGK